MHRAGKIESIAIYAYIYIDIQKLILKLQELNAHTSMKG